MPHMDVRRIIGLNIRRYRIAAGMSQEELAAEMDVEQGYVSGLEAGRRNPTAVTLAAAAEALGIKLGLLFESGSAKSEKGGRKTSRASKSEKRR
jgi:transcriptional regulator with XRE-family HTH domain